jgi:uncharacterized protein
MKTSTISTFLEFLKKPNQVFLDSDKRFSKDLTFSQKILFFIKILSFSGITAYLLGVLGTTIVELFTDFSVSDNNIIFAEVGSFPIWAIVSLIVFIGPLTEELAFRLFFSKNKKVFFTGLIFFSLFIGGVILDIITRIFEIEVENIPVLLGFLPLILSGFTILLSIILNLLISNHNFEIFIKKNFTYFFYGISIIFGLIHINNYLNIDQIILISPLLVLPQIFVSFIFGFLRVEFDFLWAFLGHAVYNFFLGAAVFLLLFFLEVENLEVLVADLNAGRLQVLIENLDPVNQIGLSISIGLVMLSYLVIFGIFVWVIVEYFLRRNIKLESEL